MASLNAFSQVLGIKNARHLLRRATFGPTHNQLVQFSSLNPTQALNILLNPEKELPTPPVDPKTGKSWVNPPDQSKAGAGNSEQEELHGFFKSWHLDVMLKSGTSLQERITWFYHTHLPARWTEIRSSEAIYYQNMLFRKYAFGSFKELFKKIITDNAMLVYLDGYTNHKDNPNENFGREMFELYSIGKGPQIAEGNYTNYTEDDIKAATKILTGWVIDKDFTNTDPDTGIPTGILSSISQGNPPVLLATGHDSSVKTFSPVFGGKSISPSEIINNRPTAAATYNELSEMIDMIFGQKETARFISRKIYRFFVYHFISAEVERDIIEPMADILMANNYSIKEVLKVLLKSQHFYDADNAVSSDDNIGALIKSPVELFTGLMRFFNVGIPDRLANATSFYSDMSFFTEEFVNQGLDYYEPFEVAGYSAYHQVPGFSRNWITTNSLVFRYRIGQLLMKRTGDKDKFSFRLDILDWIENSGVIPNPGNASDTVRLLADHLLGVIVNQERFDFFLKTIFLDSLSQTTWQYEWDNYKSSGNDAVVRERFETLLFSLIETPEFQLF